MQPATQFVQSQPDATLNRAERQSGCIGNLLMRLAADKGATDQISLAGWQAIDELPEQLVAVGRIELLEYIMYARVRQPAQAERERAIFAQLNASADREQSAHNQVYGVPQNREPAGVNTPSAANPQ